MGFEKFFDSICCRIGDKQLLKTGGLSVSWGGRFGGVLNFFF